MRYLLTAAVAISFALVLGAGPSGAGADAGGEGTLASAPATIGGVRCLPSTSEVSADTENLEEDEGERAADTGIASCARGALPGFASEPPLALGQTRIVPAGLPPGRLRASPTARGPPRG